MNSHEYCAPARFSLLAHELFMNMYAVGHMYYYIDNINNNNNNNNKLDVFSLFYRVFNNTELKIFGRHRESNPGPLV